MQNALMCHASADTQMVQRQWLRNAAGAIYILAERLPDWIEGLGDLRRRRKPLTLAAQRMSERVRRRMSMVWSG